MGYVIEKSNAYFKLQYQNNSNLYSLRFPIDTLTYIDISKSQKQINHIT